jgi:hypothetical protein
VGNNRIFIRILFINRATKAAPLRLFYEAFFTPSG